MSETKKRGRPSKAQTEKMKREAELEKNRKQRADGFALALFAVGALCIALAFVEGQSVWLKLHTVMFGLFGLFSYVVGAFMVFAAIYTALGKKPAQSLLKALLLLLSVSGAFLINSAETILTGKLLEDVSVVYLEGTGKVGGGVLSMFLGWPLKIWLGDTGAKISIIILIFVSVMLITGKTLLDLINGIKKPIDTIRDTDFSAITANLKREKKQGAKFDIDVPIDAEATKTAKVSQNCGQDFLPLIEDMPVVSTQKKPSSYHKISGIDIPLGPEFLPSEPIDIDVIEPKKQRTGPAAEVVSEIFDREEKVSDLFADFKEIKHSSGSDALNIKITDSSSLKSSDQNNFQQEFFPEDSYRFPPLSLLQKPAKTSSDSGASAELKNNAAALVSTLESFGVKTRVVDISRGPTVTRYEIQPEAGVRLSRIVNLADDLALNLAAMGVRIEAPIPGKAAVGIEVPNKQTSIVNLRTVIESEEFKKAKSPLSIALGVDITGGVQIADISSMPHLLIAGTTGMGKSVCINSLILSIVYKSTPEETQLILVDPKIVEFGVYQGLPHLYIPVVTDPNKAAGALGSAVGEMLRRYKLFAEYGVRNIGEYNAVIDRDYSSGLTADGEAAPERKTRIVIIIDELADLMMTAPNEVEDAICRIAQMGRAAGIHLVVATQRPSVDVITGTIKNNIPTRIAFKVSSLVDSRTILDGAGAEKLIGRGDMLFHAVGKPKPIRIQGCYVGEDEVSRVVTYLKKNAAAKYNEQFIKEMEENAAREKNGKSGAAASADDPMLEEAIEVVVEAGQASTSLLQRRLKLGYARAARIMDDMEAMGVIGPSDGSKPRVVKMTRQQWQERLMRKDSE